MPKKTPKVVLIDSHALLHRAYHALPPMNTKEGVPTNAVYGFTTTLFKVFTSLKPTHVVAAFDMPGPTFRHAEFAEYKAHRIKPDDELISQFGLARKLSRAFNIPVFEAASFEADDIIGTLVTKIGPQIHKVIVTGDADALQLVDDTTVVYTPKRGIGDTMVYNAAAVEMKYGFAPPLLIDYKGLAGDASDGIPGVAGIGDKTARSLVATYGPIENIYKHLAELPPRVQSRLKGQKAAAIASRRLATIKRDVPLKFELSDAVLDDYDTAAAEAMLVELEFRSLVNRLPKSSRTAQGSLFRGAEAPKPKITMPAHYHLVKTVAEQKKLKKLLSAAKVIAFDTETDRLGARTSPIVGMSFATRTNKKLEAWYVPVTPESVKEWRDLLEDPKVGKVGQNLKYDVTVLRQSGITLKPIVFDSMLASYLLNPGARQHNLDYLAETELNHHTIHLTDLIGTGKEQKAVSEVLLNDLAVYAAEDADVAFRLYEKLSPRIAEQGLTRVFSELEMPLISVLSTMEGNGVRLDTKLLVDLSKKMKRRLNTLRQKIWEAAGGEFNVNSTQQLREILYTKLALPTDGIARTQSGYSTAAAELLKLRDKHPIIVWLEEYRELSKLLNTYIETLPHLVDPKTKRIHTSFNQAVAATGRLSSQDPNLQNIPARTELGQEIRAAFVAAPKTVLIKADYSQLELRIAAHLSQDPKMLQAFRESQDIHRATAAWVNDIEPKQVTDAQRRAAKTLNFGVLYGMGARAFAQTAGISVEEARSFIGRYQAQYPKLMQLIEETIKQAETLGYVETMMGRRRAIPEIHARSPQIRAQAERIAFNMPIQGSAADILKKAMIELQIFIDERYPDVKLLLTVHDELVVEAPKELAPKFAKEMQRVMSNVVTLDVPLEVDVAAGPNWRDVKPVKT